jgi:hypothetical protein
MKKVMSNDLFISCHSCVDVKFNISQDQVIEKTNQLLSFRSAATTF